MKRTVKIPAANMLKYNMERYSIKDSDIHILEEGIGFGTRKPKNNPKKRKTKNKPKET